MATATKRKASKDVDLKWIDAPAAEKIDNSQPVRIEPTMLDVGQFFPQGDVALRKLASVPADATRVAKPSAQIVEGTTQGSRHIWDSLDGAEVFQPANQTALEGFVYRLSKTRTLTHPEHANHVYVVANEPQVFQCIFQRSHAEELRRIRD